jgi:hypothetical protein
MEIFPFGHEVTNCVHAIALLNGQEADLISIFDECLNTNVCFYGRRQFCQQMHRSRY